MHKYTQEQIDQIAQELTDSDVTSGRAVHPYAEDAINEISAAIEAAGLTVDDVYAEILAERERVAKKAGAK